jgi:hypothetical protein
MRRSESILTLMLAAGVLAPLPAAAAPADLATIERECARQLKMSATACKCMRDRAAKLNDKQQQFVAAVVRKDRAAQKRIQQTMTVQELTEAGTFMTEAPAQCRGRG